MSRLQRYFEVREDSVRIDILQQMKQCRDTIPLDVIQDIFCLPLKNIEKSLLIQNIESDQGLALEHFLTSSLMDWNQDLVASALEVWSEKTDTLLWYRLLPLVCSPHVTQRTIYSALNFCHKATGSLLLQSILERNDLFDWSLTLQAFLLERSVQWSVHHDDLEDLCIRILKQDRPDQWNSRAFAAAVVWSARFQPEVLNPIDFRSKSLAWSHIISCLIQQSQKKGTLGKKIAEDNLQRVEQTWPLLWHRHKLKAPQLAEYLPFLVRENQDLWHWCTGIDEKVLENSLDHISCSVETTKVIGALQGLLPYGLSLKTLKSLQDKIAQAENPAEPLSYLPVRLRLKLTGNTGPTRDMAVVLKEEKSVISGEKVDFSGFYIEEKSTRKDFFKAVYSQEYRHPLGDDIWSSLTRAWNEPPEGSLDTLTAMARKNGGIAQLGYIKVLSKQHRDEAVLKLLDYVRSQQHAELKMLVTTLGAIGTARAAQELVSLLSRPNVKLEISLDICKELQNYDLTVLQDELRSTLSDLRKRGIDEFQLLEEALVPLLLPMDREESLVDQKSGGQGEDLDRALEEKIPYYNELSTEVRRALRTAQFFSSQEVFAISSIDLSPTIDMQYKALELLFRESFEESVQKLLTQGILQRRLDVVGYARPIPASMDRFENMLAGLPIVRDIPFFSRFKLRKMLRAICQYRPGKRFTLDGVKAFALFFLCFGRKQCEYGMQDLFPLDFQADSELAMYCKHLHTFQDFRNRAAHEGFHPEARDDLVGIWEQTSEIIGITMRLRHALWSLDEVS
ncbi:MAG: hypothetical protein AB8C84_00060 [Oligoflexales bacterium]